jgi:hypothetical protein
MQKKYAKQYAQNMTQNMQKNAEYAKKYAKYKSQIEYAEYALPTLLMFKLLQIPEGWNQCRCRCRPGPLSCSSQL